MIIAYFEQMHASNLQLRIIFWAIFAELKIQQKFGYLEGFHDLSDSDFSFWQNLEIFISGLRYLQET